MMKGYIYKYTFSDNKVYIGQTRRHPEVRQREHLSQSIGKSNPGFWDAYQRLGEPVFEIIDTVEEKRETDLVDTLNRAETFYIEMYQAANPRFGYNKKTAGTVSSQESMILRDEFRDLWEAHAEPCIEFYKSLFKKVVSKADPLTDEEKRILREEVLTPDNIFYHRVKEYDLDNLSENSDDDDFWLGEVFQGFMMDLDMALSYEFSECINLNQNEIISRRYGKTIQQVDFEGKVVREYHSNKEVLEALQIARIDNILNVLKGRQKTAYGFRWKYKED